MACGFWLYKQVFHFYHLIMAGELPVIAEQPPSGMRRLNYLALSHVIEFYYIFKENILFEINNLYDKSYFLCYQQPEFLMTHSPFPCERSFYCPATNFALTGNSLLYFSLYFPIFIGFRFSDCPLISVALKLIL